MRQFLILLLLVARSFAQDSLGTQNQTSYHYQQLFTFDGERFPIAASFDFEIDPRHDQNMRFGFGGAPITPIETTHFVFSFGVSYYYRSMVPLDTLLPTVGQNLSLNIFTAGDFHTNWWWFSYASYGIFGDRLFENSPFKKSQFFTMNALGYRFNSRLTLGLSLALGVGADNLFYILPIPTFRAALIPHKLWFFLGPTPETGVSYRPIEKLLFTSGYRIGGEVWYDDSERIYSFSQARQGVWLSVDVKVAPLVWLYTQGEITTKRSSTYDTTAYPLRGALYLSAGVRFTPDWKGNEERALFSTPNQQ